MISRPVTVSPVKAILAMRLLEASALPISAPGPLTTFSTPGGTTSPMTSAELEDRPRRRAGRLDHRAVAGGQRRGDLPRRHQQREVERDDLADDAERLAEVVGVRSARRSRRSGPPRRGSRRRSSGSGRSASGMSAASVSRTGLPFSQLSATASISRLASIASAMAFSTAARSAAERRCPTRPWRRARRRARARCRAGVERGDLAERLAGRRASGSRGTRRSSGGDPRAADEVLVARPSPRPGCRDRPGGS